MVGPVDIGPYAVAAVNNDPPSPPRDACGLLTAAQIEKRAAKEIWIQRAAYDGNGDIRMSGKLRIDPMSNQMGFNPTVRQEESELVVALVHPAGFYKITGNQ